MDATIEIRVGVFVDADTATPLEHKQAFVLAAQRMRNRSKIGGLTRQAKPVTIPRDFNIDAFAPDDIDGPTLAVFGKLAADCTRDELQAMMRYCDERADACAAEAQALAAEKQRRFGADVIAFPGGAR